MSQDKIRFWFIYALAVIIIASFLFMLGLTLFGITKVDSALAGTLIGYLSAKAERVISFYFSDSDSNQRKDELLHQSMPMAAKSSPEDVKQEPISTFSGGKQEPIDCGE